MNRNYEIVFDSYAAYIINENNKNSLYESYLSYRVRNKNEEYILGANDMISILIICFDCDALYIEEVYKDWWLERRDVDIRTVEDVFEGSYVGLEDYGWVFYKKDGSEINEKVFVQEFVGSKFSEIVLANVLFEKFCEKIDKCKLINNIM